MAFINFTSLVPFIDPTRRGLRQSIEFYPISPNGFTVLQSDQINGNRAEWWSMDQKTVEVCQHPFRSEAKIIIPCIPEEKEITGTGANEIVIYGKPFYDEWHQSVQFGEEFEIDATGIPGIIDYWHDPAGTAGDYSEPSFFCILKSGTVNWERIQREKDFKHVYEYTLSFTISLVRTLDQYDFEYPN